MFKIDNFQHDARLLQVLLKSAWLLRNDDLTKRVLEVIVQAPLPSVRSVAFIAARRNHRMMAEAIDQISNRLDVILQYHLSQPIIQSSTIVPLIDILVIAECFKLPEPFLSKLRAIIGEPSVHRFLAHVALRHQDWNMAWYEFELARLEAPGDLRHYTDLGDLALYFDNRAERINVLLDQRRVAGVEPQGYDKLMGLKCLLEADYCGYLRLRDAQVSNLVARQVYGAAVRRSMGTRATAYVESDNVAFVIGRDGVSDELRWSYYYAQLPDYFAQVDISCDPRLEQLFKRSFPGINFFPVSRNWGRAQIRSHHIPRDKVPNMELASRLDNSAFAVSIKADEVMFIEDVPLRDWITRDLSGPPRQGEPRGATIQPDPARVSHWRRRLRSDAGTQLKVGLIWRSGLIDADRQRHYMQLPDFAELLKLPATFYALQHQVTERERMEGEAMGVRFVDDIVDFYNDFEEIAAMTSGLDLVLGVSTLPYELAAAVGTECWLCAISPLGRWMRLGQDGTSHDRLSRNGSVFFPQTDDGYLSPRAEMIDSVIDQIKKALQERGAR